MGGDQQNDVMNYKMQLHVGSVLPFVVAPNMAHDIYILLGKENRQGKYGKILEDWCGFGGAAESYDLSSIEQTAAREFVEESMALPLLKNTNNNNTSVHDFLNQENVFQDLQNGEYVQKVEMKKAVRSNHVVNFTGFLKRIPWQPDLPQQFSFIRKYLLQLRTACCAHNDACNQIFSKDECLIEISDNNYKICNKKTEESYAKTWNTEEKNYQNVLETRKQMLQTYNEIPDCIRRHPAITLHTVCYQETEYLYDITVSEAYLEKSEVQWWSLPRLYDALRDGGVLRKSKFRYTFLPFLSVVLDLFHQENHDENFLCDSDNKNWCQPHNTDRFSSTCSSLSSPATITHYEINIEPWRSKS